MQAVQCVHGEGEEDTGEGCSVDDDNADYSCGLIARNLPIGFRKGSNTLYHSKL